MLGNSSAVSDEGKAGHNNYTVGATRQTLFFLSVRHHRHHPAADDALPEDLPHQKNSRQGRTPKQADPPVVPPEDRY
ncbi:hypothetical protein H2248_005306 [Termitomyces sp. 'cryptogamus']|nr:hypothetical protein H2248_005306 [Termitomyces sp. 'cryptogamus']